MARLFTSGFEVGSASANVEDPNFSRLGTGGTPTVQSTTVRSGSFAQKLVNSTATDEKWQFTFAGNVSNNYTFYMRVCVYVGAFGNPTLTWPLNLFGQTGGHGIEVKCDSSGNLTMASADNDTSYVTGPQIVTGQWYVLEVAYTPGSNSSDPGASFAQFWVNGTNYGTTSTAEGIGTGDSTFVFAWGCASTSTQATWYFDDVAINDSTGASQNGRCGYQNKVVLLKPTSDSATTGFTEGAGGTGSLFAAVDNTPPIGKALASATNTSQIKDATSNTTDNYKPNLGAYTTALASGGGGLGSADTVVLVQGICNHGNSSTTGRVNGLQVISNPTIAETTATTSASAGTFPTGWHTFKTAVSYGPSVTLNTGPVMEFRKATASTDSAMCDFMGLYVEYTPGVPATPITNSIWPQALWRSAYR